MNNPRKFLRIRFDCFYNNNSNLFVRRKHAFKTSPLTLSQLENHLKKSAKFENGILAVDKPVGVSFERGLIDSDSKNPSLDVSLKNALPSLKELVNAKELFNIKIPERNISGVTLFSNDLKVVGEVQKSLREMRERREFPDIYHAIVIGEPQFPTGQFNGTISLQTKNGVKRMVLSEKIGQNAVKRGDEKRVTVNYRTLATNGAASFLEIEANRTKWNCVRVYLATQTLTPVLGDELYGTYVKRLLGTQVPADVFLNPTLPKQKLPESLSKQLGLVGRKDITVPLHLHLSTVRIKKKKKKILEISMPLPELFKWSFDQLGLSDNHLVAASTC